jgi:phospholipid/cholesterol/gamma-HCH transport system permease protein
VTWRPARPQPLAFVDELLAGGGSAEPAPASRAPLVTRPLHRTGRFTVGLRHSALDHLSLLGGVVAVLGRACLSPRRFRLPSIVRHVYDTGFTAIPIVALIAFLIAVIVAYIGAQQLRLYGGEIYVADLVTVSVLRELGVLLTAIIVAGRSGSAFAAEIGVMQLNDEVDALRAIGLDPVEVLVVPRVLGLVLALPLLTVVANAMGLAGGALLTWSLVDMTFAQYWDRVNESIAPTTFWAGMLKAPVFAVVIGLIATLRGLQVRDSSRELGRLTTVAVVQSIFLVILVDALFAVLYMEIDF